MGSPLDQVEADYPELLGFAPLMPGSRGGTVEGGEHMPTVKERTKEQLYREAKRLNIKGRSKMNKGALKAALARRGH